MRKYLKVLVVISGFVILLSYLARAPKRINVDMNICFNTPWKSLHPGTQNTMIGGLIISQQFESLVKLDSDGNVIPGLAKFWTIANDFKSIRFKLDQAKKFSNGNPVTTDDVFNSWVTSFNMSKTGPNNSLKDVLYNVIGFKEGSLPDQIKGLKKVNDNEFEIHFNKPFRMAIYHLRGARFAVYQEQNGQIFGSGRFTYDVNSTENLIKLRDLQFNRTLDVSYLKTHEINNALKNGKCDLYYAPSGGNETSISDTESIGHIISDDAVHLSLFLNTKSGIFQDVAMRRAFLYLIHKDSNSANLFLENPNFSKADPQIYNVFSQGRLSDSEAREIIEEGKSFVPEFLKRIKKEKVKMFVNSSGHFKEGFEQIGIADSVVEDTDDARAVTQSIYNGTFKQDMTPGFISVISFDPDGIYHALGAHGAILTPYTSNYKIFEMLEAGRELINRNEIHLHYKKLSKVFLREVPFVHLGYAKNVLYFNKNRIHVSSDNFKNTLDFSSFVEN